MRNPTQRNPPKTQDELAITGSVGNCVNIDDHGDGGGMMPLKHKRNLLVPAVLMIILMVGGEDLQVWGDVDDEETVPSIF